MCKRATVGSNILRDEAFEIEPWVDRGFEHVPGYGTFYLILSVFDQESLKAILSQAIEMLRY